MEAYQPLLTYFAFGLYMLLLAIAAATDIWTFKIPNWVSIALFLLFFPVALLSPGEIDWLSHLGAALAVFVGGILLYIMRWFGAGDVKLMAAVAIWVGFPHLLAFLFFITLAGGVLSAFLLALRFALPRLPQPAAGPRNLPHALTKGGRVPYGVAISAGSIFLGFSLPLLSW